MVLFRASPLSGVRMPSKVISVPLVVVRRGAVASREESHQTMAVIRDVELAVAARACPGESPVWDSEARVLWWVDIGGEAVHRFDPSTREDRKTDARTMVGAVAPRIDGGLVAAVREGFAFLDFDSGAIEIVHVLGPSAASVRMNDGKCDHLGRFWAGTMGLGAESGAGALYRLDATPVVATFVLDGITVSNGLDWSLDGSRMYFVDTPSFGIDIFDFESEAGVITNRRRLVEVDRAEGLLDGLTVDAEDHIWVALHGSGSIRRYTPAGSLESIVEFPVPYVTSCAFGGEDLCDLYVTTSATRLSASELEAHPLAGSLFRCRPGVRGNHSHRFAG